MEIKQVAFVLLAFKDKSDSFIQDKFDTSVQFKEIANNPFS